MSSKVHLNKRKTNKIKEKKQNQNINNEDVELLNLKNQLIRVNADFDNFKKRVAKERAAWEDLAQINIINLLLPLFDDLQRALDNTKEESSVLFDGLNMILKNSKKIFNDLSIKEIDCSSGFNPDLHEALIQVDSKKHKSGEIVQVLNKGYTLKDKVIRHAKVTVAK